MKKNLKAMSLQELLELDTELDRKWHGPISFSAQAMRERREVEQRIRYKMRKEGLWLKN